MSAGDKRQRSEDQVPEVSAPPAKKAKYALPEKPDVTGMTDEDAKAAETKWETEKRKVTLANRHLESAGKEIDWNKARKAALPLRELEVESLSLNLKKPAEAGKFGPAVNQNWFDILHNKEEKKLLQIEWNGHISRGITPNQQGGVNAFVVPELPEDDAKFRAIQVSLKKQVQTAPKEWKPSWTDVHMEFQNMVYVQNPVDAAIREKHKENPIPDLVDEQGKPIECYPSSVKVKILEPRESKDPKKKKWKPKTTKFLDMKGNTLNPATDFPDGTPVTVTSQLSSGYYDNKAKGQPPKKKYGFRHEGLQIVRTDSTVPSRANPRENTMDQPFMIRAKMNTTMGDTSAPTKTRVLGNKKSDGPQSAAAKAAGVVEGEIVMRRDAALAPPAPVAAPAPAPVAGAAAAEQVPGAPVPAAPAAGAPAAAAPPSGAAAPVPAAGAAADAPASRNEFLTKPVKRK